MAKSSNTGSWSKSAQGSQTARYGNVQAHINKAAGRTPAAPKSGGCSTCGGKK